MNEYRRSAKKLIEIEYTEDTKDDIELARVLYEDVATMIYEQIKESREKALALTNLENACMWTIKAIARGEKQ